MERKFYSVIILLFLLIKIDASYCQAGSLDITFDNDGIVTTDFGMSADYIESVAIQSDGKIVVAGNNFAIGGYNFVLARYNADGTLDNSFDLDGIVVTDLGVTEDFANAMVLQSDGKIVVVGKSELDLTVVRYNTNGSLDVSFDTDGIVMTNLGGWSSYATSVAIQSDGKIVVAGAYYDTGTDFALVRFNSNGTFDNSFDFDGIVVTSIGANTDIGNSVIIQSDGKIIVAGSSNNGTNNDFAVARYNTNGSLDITFSSDGKLTTSFGGGNDVANSVAIQSDGKIIVAGVSHNGLDRDLALARYNSNGFLDVAFDSDGKMTTAIGTNDNDANQVVIQSDGKIIVVGSSNNGINQNFTISRYTTAGALDLTYDTDGIVTTDYDGFDDYIMSIAIQSDGKIVTAGVSHFESDPDFALARYDVNGNLDLTFNMDGKVKTALLESNCSNEQAEAVAIQSDGKIVVGGYVGMDSGQKFALTRYNSDGTLDNTFGFDGIVSTDLDTSESMAYDLVIQSDGKILMVGLTGQIFFKVDYILVRYNSDGTLDNSFGDEGIVTTNIDLHNFGHGVAIQPDGKILIAGNFHSGNGSTNDFGLIRYNSDGTLDPSFGIAGIVTTDISGDGDLVRGLAIQSDGKIVVSGYSWNNTSWDITLVRYNTDGSLDNSFDFDGKLMTDFSGTTQNGYRCSIQTDGKILVVGSTDGEFALIRYNTDGSLDVTFDGDGLVTTDFAGFADVANALCIQSDDKIVIVGDVDNGSATSFGIVRYNSDGTLDNTFNWDGKVITAIGGTNDQAKTVALQSDGKIVVAGSTDNGITNDFAIARYMGASFVEIPETENKNQISIYPNPTNGDIIIMIAEPINNASIKLIDFTGQVIISQDNVSGTNFNFDISNQASGIYFIEINDGENVERIKVIKQ